MAQAFSPTHLSIRRGRATTTHYTHHQVSLMVLRNTTLVPSLGLCIGPACEAGLSAGMRRQRVPPKEERKKEKDNIAISLILKDAHDDYSNLGEFVVILNSTDGNFVHMSPPLLIRGN